MVLNNILTKNKEKYNESNFVWKKNGKPKDEVSYSKGLAKMKH